MINKEFMFKINPRTDQYILRIVLFLICISFNPSAFIQSAHAGCGITNRITLNFPIIQSSSSSDYRPPSNKILATAYKNVDFSCSNTTLISAYLKTNQYYNGKLIHSPGIRGLSFMVTVIDSKGDHTQFHINNTKINANFNTPSFTKHWLIKIDAVYTGPLVRGDSRKISNYDVAKIVYSDNGKQPFTVWAHFIIDIPKIEDLATETTPSTCTINVPREVKLPTLIISTIKNIASIPGTKFVLGFTCSKKATSYQVSFHNIPLVSGSKYLLPTTLSNNIGFRIYHEDGKTPVRMNDNINVNIPDYKAITTWVIKYAVLDPKKPVKAGNITAKMMAVITMH